MKKGFTLGEILIALAIVGIVAALTISPAISKYQKKLFSTRIQNEYSKIVEAISKIMDEERVENFYESKGGLTHNAECSETNKDNCTQGSGYFMNNYFDIDRKKNCGVEPCLAASYKTLSDTTISLPSFNYCIRTTRGSTVCAYTNSGKLRFVIDINGADNPNVGGRDLFYLDVQNNGKIKNTCAANASCNSDPCACLKEIEKSGWKMEY